MYLKRYRSQDVRDALRAAHRDLGPEALVLSTELVSARGWRGWMGAREIELTAAADREQAGARAAREQESVIKVSDRRPPADSVVARLTASGVDLALADEVAAHLPSAGRRGASLLSLRAALADRLSSLAADDDDYAPVEVFVGPPGVGKTTTIAKIVAQERASRGRRLGLVAADGFRIGAVEQLRMYADILGAPFKVARTAEELDRVLSTPQRRPLLVDTAGQSVSDSAARDLLRFVARRSDIRTHLVLAADTPVATARRIFDTYAEARPTRIVLTKLDEAGSLSPLVGLLRDRLLPISYLGTGQRVPEDLNRATAQLLAASVLGESRSVLQPC
jgi:flagellar biosynthesis protein FlhF